MITIAYVYSNGRYNGNVIVVLIKSVNKNVWRDPWWYDLECVMLI